MAQKIPTPEETSSPETAILNQAIRLIGEQNFPKAKELLTGLLQTDQHNATYWVWLSAAMDTQKERLYCLQMAYKVDPANPAARRGLILMGALEPDGSQTPFPMNHPRLWEHRLKLAEDKDKPKGIKRVTSNPFVRLGTVLVLSIALVGGAIFGIGAYITRPVAPVNLTPATPRPTVTPIPRKSGPTVNATLEPFSALLKGGTYTPTPLYALTPHTDVASDPYRAALSAYNKQQWSGVVSMMEQIATIQPGSVDAIYFMGEGKRLSGQFDDAIVYYRQAAKINAKYAPIYLGLARANLGISSQRAVLTDLNKAIELDKNYAEAYLERGLYFSRRGDTTAARKDLEQASLVNPNSPIIQVNLARLLLTLGENEAALAAAQKAKELDVTMEEAYLLIGIAARASGQIDLAVDVLDTYTQRSQKPKPEAYTILGAAYFNRDEYELGLKNVNLALKLDAQSAEAYRWRGEIYLATKEYQKAFDDFKKSYTINITFDAGMGIAKSILAKTDPKADAKKARDSYFEALFYIGEVEKQLKTDKQRGIYFYYRATVLELLNEQIAASRTWNSLLQLPTEAVSEEMRQEAQERFISLQSATPPAPTERPSATPKVTLTPTKTPTPKITLSPTQTPTPKN